MKDDINRIKVVLVEQAILLTHTAVRHRSPYWRS